MPALRPQHTGVVEDGLPVARQMVAEAQRLVGASPAVHSSPALCRGMGWSVFANRNRSKAKRSGRSPAVWRRAPLGTPHSRAETLP